MDRNENIYYTLQKHLDQQAVGFPATRSKAEIKILKYIFAPREAEIALFLSHKPTSFNSLFCQVDHLVESRDDLRVLLENLQKKGGIESKMKDGEWHYSLLPLVVGMYEMQLGRLTPEFLKDFKDYTSSLKFGLELLNTELPQMRTIPVARSLAVLHNVSTFDEVAALLQQADPPFVILECICRKKKVMEGQTCRVTERTETCLALGSLGQAALMSECGREISRDEARSILDKNQKQGLVLQPSNTVKADFICSCCGCCCGMLGIHKKLPKPLDFWASNFYAVVDQTACNGCGACEKRCQVDAIRLSTKNHHAAVDLNRCLGCGACVLTCPTKAVSLFKKQNEIIPPNTKEELYDIIMAGKKGRFGKLATAGKLIVDAIRTGHIK